jgi:phenylacetate-CoA ligase
MIEYWRLHREQWLPGKAVKQRQWARLKTILRHAFDNSPFYRRRFEKAGITPEDIRDLSDLQRLPVTTREDLRDPDSMIAKGLTKSRLIRSHTSGSTGRVTTTYFDRRAWKTGKILLKLRARVACGVRPWDRLALFQEGHQPNSWPRQVLLRKRSFSILEALPEILPEVQAYAPTVLYGFPSYLMRLAQVAGGKIAPRLIFTSGEMLDGETRRTIEKHFQAPVFDVYGCTELKEIAWECPLRDGYHINSDRLVVEAQQSEDLTAGATSTLLVTSLYNFGMPLIRYQLGDTGRLIETMCPCGRGFPLMAPALGRSVDYFALPDGTTVSPYAMTCAIENVQGLSQYQIVQQARDQVVVRVVPSRQADPLTERQINLALSPILPGVQLSVHFVDGIEREPSGKYRIVVSHVPKS